MREHEAVSGDDSPNSTTRRRLLSVSAGALAVGLAGCSGSDDDTENNDSPNNGTNSTPETNSNERNPNGESSTESNEDSERVTRAVEELVAVHDQAETMQAEELAREQSTIDTLSVRLETARTTLENVSATGEQQQRVEALLTVADFQELLVQYQDVAFAHNQQLQRMDALGSVGEFQRAQDAAQQAETEMETLKTTTQELETAQDEIRREGLERDELRYSGPVFQHIRPENDDLFDRWIQFNSALQEYAAFGDRLVQGYNEYTDEQWDSARDSLSSARQQGESARAQFDQLLSQEGLRLSWIRSTHPYIDVIDQLLDDIESYQAAIDAAEAGNTDEAQQIIDNTNAGEPEGADLFGTPEYGIGGSLAEE